MGVDAQLVFGEADSLVATGTSTKTIAQVRAAANHGVDIVGFGIYGDSVDLDAVPVPAELLRQTTDGTMTGATVTKGNDSNADTLDTTGGHTATAEPTAGDILHPFQYAPSAGYVFMWPQDARPHVGAADRVGLRVLTPAVDHNVNGWISFKE